MSRRLKNSLVVAKTAVATGASGVNSPTKAMPVPTTPPIVAAMSPTYQNRDL